MKRSEKAKAGPKFRVGQVVRFDDCISKGLFGFPDYAKVSRISRDTEGFSCLLNRKMPWLNEELLRPLTARESGQRQRKGKA